MAIKSDLQTLITNLCRDETLDGATKFQMLTEWEEEMISRNRNMIMTKEMAEEHFHDLEMLKNAQRIVKPTEPKEK